MLIAAVIGAMTFGKAVNDPETLAAIMEGGSAAASTVKAGLSTASEGISSGIDSA